jgi:bacterioferritin
MQGNREVIEALNDVLTAELTAINQYFVHAKMRRNWGFEKLAKKAHEESIGEMKDADKLIERILFLEGIPNLQRLHTVRVGETVVEQLELERDTEKAAVERLNRAIGLCRERADEGTCHLLIDILEGEEESLDWLETQLHLITTLGAERYLAEQL